MHAKRLLYSICVPSLVLIAQAVFLSERGQTDGQTDATDRPTHAGCCIAAGVGNLYSMHARVVWCAVLICNTTRLGQNTVVDLVRRDQ